MPRAGLSLLETATALSLTGVVLAAFVPTFMKHVRVSKLSEATDLLEALHEGAVAYYTAHHKVSGRTLWGCLPESAGPFPSTPSVDPAPVSFAEDKEGAATWSALGLTEPKSLRFSYSVIVEQPGCAPHPSPRGAPVITFRAEGDLDGDGVKSLIERSATLSQDQRTLVPLPLLRIERRVE